MHRETSSPVAKRHEIRRSPVTPHMRRSLRPENTEGSLNDNFHGSYAEGKRAGRRNTSNLSKSDESSRNNLESYDSLMTDSFSEEDDEVPYLHLERSRTVSPERNDYSEASTLERKKDRKQNRKNTAERKEYSPDRDTGETGQSTSCIHIFWVMIVVVLAVLASSTLSKNQVHTQSVSKSTSLLSESMNSIKATFHSQELDIWNDISSAINEVMSRNPKAPSIILLFAKESTAMNCLATELANASSTILHADSYLVFNPEDFGNDAGEIITTLNKHPPEKKKVVLIRDILNINAEAIKGLHNLCDRVNPLVAEAIYILTMQTNDYQPSQKKLHFVEKQLYGKLSKSIDCEVLMALVTRITDGAIIWVQPEPQLRYC
ncbi:PREDICTED: uncharacterized protein LOC105559512 [Vollenhovia emeryi]|uniref:uncharacterized protein LOC105559512 n=1 Tax=Vollenhovia emeryi TaxID=411798 RepID=UPI0005F54708|nr:PREDICTED: uncharacterized protein LOC105559512 [Vollenhovia emeryi]